MILNRVAATGRMPTGFSPIQVAGLALWVRGDLGLSNGSTVTSWPDLSGNGHNLAGTNGAVFNSSGGPNNQPYLSSTGIVPITGLQALFTLNQPYEIFIVAKWDAAFASGSMINDGGGGVNFGRLFRSAATTIDTTGQQGNISGTYAATTNWTIYNVRYAAAANSLTAGGVTIASNATPVSAAPAGLTLFQDGRLIGANASKSSIAEVIEFSLNTPVPQLVFGSMNTLNGGMALRGSHDNPRRCLGADCSQQQSI